MLDPNPELVNPDPNTGLRSLFQCCQYLFRMLTANGEIRSAIDT